MTAVAITIGNRREELPRITAAVDRFAARHGLIRDVVADLQVALSEILTNIIDYAYSDQGQHEIRIRLQMTGSMIEATIEDDGIPFNPLEKATPAVDAALEDRRIGGLGIHFVRNLMSEIRYNRIGHRNCLVLRRSVGT